MTAVTLKKATIKDVPEFVALGKIVNSKMYAARTTNEEIEYSLKNEFVFSIKKQNETVGLVIYRIKEGNIAKINSLAIYSKYQGNGYAKQAMNLLLIKLKKFSQIKLEVHPHNTSALCLYLSLGFVIDSWRENRFGDGEPRIVMVKNK
jgi:ribosomal protein S18 acetylase RimI-like enzyme